jgi:hypothetical protein
MRLYITILRIGLKMFILISDLSQLEREGRLSSVSKRPKRPFPYFKTSREIIRLALMLYVRFPTCSIFTNKQTNKQAATTTTTTKVRAAIQNSNDAGTVLAERFGVTGSIREFAMRSSLTGSYEQTFRWEQLAGLLSFPASQRLDHLDHLERRPSVGAAEWPCPGPSGDAVVLD